VANRKRRHMEIREGDRWEFHSNEGFIPRAIKAIEGPEIPNRRVYYTNASGEFTSCLYSTFKRWWRGAEIVSATDWSGRDNDGNLTSPTTGADGGGE
jgi:hypothetical protein